MAFSALCFFGLSLFKPVEDRSHGCEYTRNMLQLPPACDVLYHLLLLTILSNTVSIW